MSQKLLFILALICLLTASLLAVLVSCEIRNKLNDTEKTVSSYAVDSTQVVGDTVEQRVESFRSIFNKKTEGFSRFFVHFDEGKLSYYLMVYGDKNVFTVSDRKVFFTADFKEVVKTIFVNASLIDKDSRGMTLYLVDYKARLWAMQFDKEKMASLPPERWEEALEPVIFFDVLPVAELPINIRAD